MDFSLPDDACISIAALQADQGPGRPAPAGRRRDGRRAVPGAQRRQVGRAQDDGGAADRQGDLGDLFAAPQEEHRLLLDADGDGEGRDEAQGRDRVGPEDRPRSSRCPSSIPTSGSRFPRRRSKALQAEAADFGSDPHAPSALTRPWSRSRRRSRSHSSTAGCAGSASCTRPASSAR